MKNVLEQLSTYKSCHLNQQNLYTHFVGIPMIIFAVLIPMGWLRLEVLPLTGSVIFVIGVLIYYLLLEKSLALGMVVFILPTLYLSDLVAQMKFSTSAMTFLGVFVVGWIIQFIGHGFEKRKPAFVDDINQLLIGPLFLISEIYFALGQLKPLKDQVEIIGREKRKKLDSQPFNPTLLEHSKATSLAGRPPANLGLHNGKLFSGPNLPISSLRQQRNWVCSQDSDAKRIIAPIMFDHSIAVARQHLQKTLNIMQGNQIIRQNDNYWHVEFTSRKVGFVDDVEFLFDETNHFIHVRSASRLGYSDFGVNRCRVEEIRRIFQILNKE